MTKHDGSRDRQALESDSSSSATLGKRAWSAVRRGVSFDSPSLNEPSRWLVRAALMGAWSVVLGSLALLLLFSKTIGWFLADDALDVLGRLVAIGGFAVILLAIATWFVGMFRLHRPTPLSARATDEIGR